MHWTKIVTARVLLFNKDHINKTIHYLSYAHSNIMVA